MFKKAFFLYSIQFYKAILPLVFTPLILNILGTERYGMIAFFYMLVGFLALLDAGVGGTFLKLIATNKKNITSFKKVTIVYLKVLLIFVIISTLIFLSFSLNREYIVNSWLDSTLKYEESAFSIKIIGSILAISYIKTYLTSFLNGMEKQEWVAIWSACYNTFFYVGSYFSLSFISSDLFVYFEVILVLALVDVVVVSIMAILSYHRNINEIELNKDVFSVKPKAIKPEEFSFKSILSFSLQLSGLSLIWVVATQIDRFVLSTYISLDEYAIYQIAVQLASAVAVLSAPLSQLLLPRLSAYYSERDLSSYNSLYIKSILTFIILLAPVIPYFFTFGDELISIWMNDGVIGGKVNSYAKWLVSSAFLAGLMNFTFIFLYSTGRLKQHFYAYLCYSLITIPISIFIAKYYSAIGSARFVFFHTFVFMFFWGGFQLRKNFKVFFFPILNVFLGVIFLSSLIFISAKYIPLDGDGVEGMFGVFLPPILNVLLMYFIFLIIKKYFSKFLVNI